MQIALVTGSSGFIGTNLVQNLLEDGYKVIAFDNFSASEPWKSELFKDNPNYYFAEVDICKPIAAEVQEGLSALNESGVDEIYNLACPASPPRYINIPLETIDVNVTGMRNVLELAKQYNAAILHTSTSEVYGDPIVHPQPESYRGNVNTVGPRSCYDEGKRISETICYEYQRLFATNVKIIRIFNTYGPYMDPMDGRVITNFVLQALRGEDLTIYGSGNQTRSFQYISDLITAIRKVIKLEKQFLGPINLGNPVEFTIKELAELVVSKLPDTGSKLKLIEQDPNSPYQAKHDPQQRKPDISLAKEKLGWEPKVALSQGLDSTIEYYRKLAS